MSEAEPDDWREELRREHAAAPGSVFSEGSAIAATYTGTPTELATRRDVVGYSVSTLEEDHLKKLAKLRTEAQAPLPLPPGLKIGVCLSGGGMRAFYESLGFLCGLEEIGILSYADYVASLSGSVWMLWSYLASDCKSFQEFAVRCAQPLKQRLYVDRVWTDICQKGGDAGVVDLVASLLQQLLVGQILGRDDRIVPISDLKPRNHQPYPIATFIELSQPNQPLKSQWFAVTPAELACCANGMTHAIPITAFASRFSGDRQTSKPPPQDDLAFLLAVCGSAYAAPLIDLVDAAPHWLKKLLNRLKNKKPNETVINPVMGDFRPSSTARPFHPRDGGIAFNLPLEPLLQRGCNVVLMMDASMELNLAHTACELRKASEWYRGWQTHKNAPKFPDIPSEDALAAGLKTNHIHCIENPGFNLVYLPRCTDNGTFTFCYEREDLLRAITASWNAVRAHKETILAFLKSCKPAVAAATATPPPASSK